MQIVVFHRLAYRRCTAFFQLFLWNFAIRYKVLNDRVFPHGCYRTLIECKGDVFLGISVICGGNFIVFCAIRLEKRVLSYDIFSEKCNNSCIYD